MNSCFRPASVNGNLANEGDFIMAKPVCSILTSARLAVVAALLLGVPSPVRADDVSLWVTLGDSDSLVEIDANTFKELRRIKVGARPHGLAASPDGSRLYVTCEVDGSFLVLDSVSGETMAQIPIGNDPNQLTVTHDGRFAYVPLRGENAIAVVQLDPLKLVKKLAADVGPHDAYMSVDGRHAFVGAMFGHSLHVVDTSTQEIAHTITTESGVRPMEVAPDGRTLYVALTDLIGFVVVDLDSNKVSRRVELAKIPDGVPAPYHRTFTHALTLTPEKKELWVTDDVYNLVRVVSLPDMKEIAAIPTGYFPHWFTTRPDGEVIFMSAWYSNVVTAIDVKTRKVLTNIQFERGTGPKRILAIPRKK
jgi:YVTN family beta-propeller protein